MTEIIIDQFLCYLCSLKYLRGIYITPFSSLRSNNLLYYRQSGFRKKFSAETALISMVDRMLSNLDNNSVTGLIFADFKKAFDLVDHEITIQKL